MENWLLTEVMIEQRLAASRRVSPHEVEAREHAGGLRRALAATLVRAGLRLDREAARAFTIPARDTRPEVTS
jgi:hypothetical protein